LIYFKVYSELNQLKFEGVYFLNFLF